MQTDLLLNHFQQISYPFDVIRTRLVSQEAPKILYKGTFDAAGKMLSTEGPSSFFRGIVPTFATIGPYSGFQFGFYTLFSAILDPDRSDVSNDEKGQTAMSVSLTSGALV